MSELSLVTMVLVRPDNTADAERFDAALKIVQRWASAMSIDDEMTLLDCLEQHPEIPEWVWEEARAQRDGIVARSAGLRRRLFEETSDAN